MAVGFCNLPRNPRDAALFDLVCGGGLLASVFAPGRATGCIVHSMECAVNRLIRPRLCTKVRRCATGRSSRGLCLIDPA